MTVEPCRRSRLTHKKGDRIIGEVLLTYCKMGGPRHISGACDPRSGHVMSLCMVVGIPGVYKDLLSWEACGYRDLLRTCGFKDDHCSG